MGPHLTAEHLGGQPQRCGAGTDGSLTSGVDNLANVAGREPNIWRLVVEYPAGVTDEQQDRLDDAIVNAVFDHTLDVPGDVVVTATKVYDPGWE